MKTVTTILAKAMLIVSALASMSAKEACRGAAFRLPGRFPRTDWLVTFPAYANISKNHKLVVAVWTHFEAEQYFSHERLARSLLF